MMVEIRRIKAMTIVIQLLTLPSRFPIIRHLFSRILMDYIYPEDGEDYMHLILPVLLIRQTIVGLR